MERIKKTEDVYGATGAEAVADRLRARGMSVGHPVEGEPVGTPVFARVDHGRWLAECECRSAQILDPDDRRFFCVRCENATNGGRWRPVEWPDDPDSIEAVLLARPRPENRNWQPHENLDTIMRENEAHGLPPAQGGV